MIKIPQHRDIQFVAQLLGATKRWVWDRVRAKEFEAFQSDRKIYINMESVQRYIAERAIKNLEQAQPPKQRMTMVA